MIPTLSPAQVTLIGSIVAPAIFALCAYFTRAGMRRIAGALLGVLAFGVLQYSWDRVAAVTGWWSYPAYRTNGNPPMPITIYLFSGIVFAGFGLIGWRIIRRFGWKGLLAFLAAWSLWGFFHDIYGSILFASSNFMVIDSGIIARTADFLVYLSCMGAILLVSRIAGGPFQKDRLARLPKSTAIA